ncbi:DNTTIP2 [Cordylochernes scorpioides]|uniref:DNTTIP2 n=1 Tax=Cordylochernes scorpioides TaxID=51811 RepID=A0ABY6K4P4_9ARAC|nr:DNTTIP2 [Cordylochernes scorpioides]
MLSQRCTPLVADNVACRYTEEPKPSENEDTSPEDMELSPDNDLMGTFFDENDPEFEKAIENKISNENPKEMDEDVKEEEELEDEPISKDKAILPSFLNQKLVVQKERELTAGENWNHLKAPELTEELKNEITILNHKRAIDPKTFFKRTAVTKEIPKHFHYGTIIESRSEYLAPGTRKESKKSLVDTLMENAEWQKSVKSRVADVMSKHGRMKRIRNIKIKGIKRRRKKHGL